MTTILVVILLIAGIAFYYYRKAKAKQAELRAKVQNYYKDIRDAIFVWGADKDNEDKLKMALISIAIYDNWFKQVEQFASNYKTLSAENFEMVDEWRNLLLNESNLREENDFSKLDTQIAYEYADLIKELRLQHT